MQPKVLGRHLIARGMKPGPEFGKVLKSCQVVQDENPDLEAAEILDQVMA